MPTRTFAHPFMANTAKTFHISGIFPSSTAGSLAVEHLAFLSEQATENADAGTCSVALRAIADGWRGDAQALAFLQDRATKDPDAQTRLASLRTIGWAYGDHAQALALL